MIMSTRRNKLRPGSISKLKNDQLSSLILTIKHYIRMTDENNIVYSVNHQSLQNVLLLGNENIANNLQKRGKAWT